jgi:hypothetical protein
LVYSRRKFKPLRQIFKIKTPHFSKEEGVK